MTHRGFFYLSYKKPPNMNNIKKNPKPNTNTFCLSGRRNNSLFHYQTQITVIVMRMNNSLCSESRRRWQVREDSPTVFSSASLSVHGNKATCFVSKPMPPNPAYLQCKLYIIQKLSTSWSAREDLLFHFILK